MLFALDVCLKIGNEALLQLVRLVSYLPRLVAGSRCHSRRAHCEWLGVADRARGRSHPRPRGAGEAQKQ
eukprot:scaffold179802_cov35-Tisochrysis_lutea.AAC.1